MRRLAFFSLVLWRCTCLPPDVTMDTFVCTQNSDCLDGWTCTKQRCVQTTCDETRRKCSDGTCVDRMRCCDAADCTVTGQTCTAGTCACPSGQRDCFGACLASTVTCVPPPAKLVFVSAPQGINAGACSAPFDVELRDAMDLPADAKSTINVMLGETGMLGLEFFADAQCQTKTPTINVTMGLHALRFYARTSLAGATRVDVSAPQLAGASQDLTVAAGPPAALGFKSPPQSLPSDFCSQPVIVEAQDASGNASGVAAGVNLTLTATPATGVTLHADAACNGALGTARIAPGTSSFTFYVKASRGPGTVRLDALGPPLTPAQQPLVVGAGPPARIVFVTAPQTVQAGRCSGALTLKVQDAQSSDTVVTQATKLSLAGPGLTFFSDAACTPANLTTGATIAAGMGTTTAYFIGSSAGMPVVTASGAGLTNATQTETITAGAAAKLGFTSAPQGVQTTVCSGPVRVSALDAFDNPTNVTAMLAVALSASPATGFSFYAGAGCTGAAITSTAIPAGQSTATFSFRGTMAGTVTMTADSSLDPDPTQATLIGVGAPTMLAYLTSPQTVNVNTCSSMVTVESRDASGNRSNAAAAVPITLTVTPATGFTLFSDAQCTMPITQASLPANASQTSWWFSGTTAGTVTVSASAVGLTGPGAQAQTLRAGPPAAVAFTTPARTALADTCSATLGLQLRDAFGNVTNAAADLPLTLGSTPAAGISFFSDSACAVGTSTATVAASSSSTSFFVKANKTPGYNLIAYEAAVGTATQMFNVTAAAVSKLVITTAPQTVDTTVCSGALTFERRDPFDNPVTTGALSLVPSGPAAVTFYTAAGCATSTSSVPFPNGASAVTVYFRSTVPGMLSLTGTAGAFMVSQTETFNCGGATRVCGAACIPAANCCITADCTAVAGQTCQGGTCACPGGQKTCGAACIATSACCNAADCTAVTGQYCDAGACTCSGSDRVCSFACIPSAACCTGADCTTPPVCKQLPASCGSGTCGYANAPNGSTCANGRTCQAGACTDIFPYAPSNFVPTAVGPVVADITLSDFNCGSGNTVHVFDTTTATFSTWCGQPQPTPVLVTQDGGIDLYVLPVRSLNLGDGHYVHFSGSRGVVLAVYGDLTLGSNSVIGASGSLGNIGAGGNDALFCGISGNGQPGLTLSDSAGGGGGGAYRTNGTPGGASGIGAQGGAAGIGASGNVTLVPLRGGCSGGMGGSSMAGDGGVGGGAGGALQVSVSGRLRINGTVQAVGGGGTGGGIRSGGGGAGSGGGLLLEADVLEVNASGAVTTNGGGGGEGGGTTASTGNNGSWGLDTTMQAPGGTGMSAGGGDGANGGTQLVPGGASAGQSTGGGGGGGGASGRIRLNARTSCQMNGTVTPNATSNGAAGCP